MTTSSFESNSNIRSLPTESTTLAETFANAVKVKVCPRVAFVTELVELPNVLDGFLKNKVNEVPVSKVFLCSKLFVPVLATFELLTILISPPSALLLNDCVTKGGLNKPAPLPTSNEEFGNKLVSTFLFCNIKE